MPRTPNAGADDKAFGERTVVVRAMRADGKRAIADARQQHVLVTDLPEQHSTVRQGIGRHAGRQVASKSRFSHEMSLSHS